MKAFKYFFISLFLVTFINESLFSADQQFGYVNVADALLLHPTMRYFNVKAKRFSLKALKGIDEGQRIAQNQDDFKKHIDELKKELAKIENERHELDSEYLAELKEIQIAEKNLKYMSESEKKKHTDKKKAIESKYYDEADNYRRKAYEQREKLEKYYNQSAYIGFTSDIETSKIFSIMIDDVYDAMGAVSEHYKVSFVFNSSAEIAFLDNQGYGDNPMRDFFENFGQTVQERDGKAITAGAFNTWLNKNNSIFLHCNDRRLTAFVMKGGLNMTPAVIDYIYQKHNIGQEQRDFIIEYFSKIGTDDNFSK